MKYEELPLMADDGLELTTHRWIPEKAHAAIVLSHGWNEHAARYHQLASWFAEQGYEVHALDHRGHGKSGGTRGHVDRWLSYARDLEALRFTIQLEDQYLLGHSMGGMISLLHSLEYPGRFKAITLSGPAADLSIKVPKLKAWLGRTMSNVYPALPIKNEIDPACVCSDPEIVADYVADPLTHGRVTARWFVEYLDTIDRVKRDASQIKTPIAIWHGEQDQLVEPWVSEGLFERLQVPQRERFVVHDAYHEILFEPNWQQTASQMKGWFERF